MLNLAYNHLILMQDGAEKLRKEFADLSRRMAVQPVLVDLNTSGDTILHEQDVQYDDDDGSLTQALEFLGNLDPQPDRDRKLRILTWGQHWWQRKPRESQFDFEVLSINVDGPEDQGRKVDFQSQDGTMRLLQDNCARCEDYPDHVSWLVQMVEGHDFQCVSVKCNKGRHRSVAFAETIRRFVYPKAEVAHLHVAKRRHGP